MRITILVTIIFANIIFANPEITATNQISSTNYFIENKGQWPEEVKYLARIGGMDAWITDQEVEVVQLASPPYLEVSPVTLFLGGNSGSFADLSVSSNVSWLAHPTVDWLDLTPISGSNDDTIRVTALSSNPSTTKSRPNTLVVVGADTTIVVEVEQQPSDEMLIAIPDSVGLAAAAGSVAIVNITANIAWTITEETDWLDVSQKGGIGDTRVGFTALTGNVSGIDKRETTVTVSGGSFNEIVKVTQFPAGGYLSVTPQNLTIDYSEGSSGEIHVASNNEWSVLNSSLWFDVIPRTGINNDTIRVEAKSTNTSYEPRRVILIISGGGFIIRVNVIQKGFEDTIPPAAPANFTATPLDVISGIYLSWNKNTEEDMHHYTIYRELTEDFEPSESNILITTEDTTYVDVYDIPVIHYYKLTAVDLSGNESDYAEASIIVDVEQRIQLPLEYSLKQNYPNPFNPSTEISYSLNQSGFVTLTVYNSLGQRVEELVKDYKEAGNHQVKFDATDIGSGVYFYKLEAKDFVETKKMVLMK